jgi:hypothetical protein
MVVRLPQRDLAESIVHLAAPLLESLGPTPSVGEARRAISLTIDLWNAHVTASNFWGRPRSKPLADLRRALSAYAGLFSLLSERWHADFCFDPRLVGDWSYEMGADGAHQLVCQTALPDGVEPEVPPPAEKRVAIGGSFLDTVQIRQGATTYLSFPAEHHRGLVDGDGVATIYAKMPTVVQLFAEGRLPPIGGPPVDVTIGVKKLGPMVLTAVHCAGDSGRHDVAALMFRPANAVVSA